jgi:hypothetical protein
MAWQDLSLGSTLQVSALNEQAHDSASQALLRTIKRSQESEYNL